MLIPRFAVVVLLLLILSGCGEQEQERELERVVVGITAVKSELQNLERALDSDQVRNAVLLKQYAILLSDARPVLYELTSVIAQDATSSGPLFQGLQSRLETVSDLQEGSLSFSEFPTLQDRMQELHALRQATSIAMFSDALSDPVNVLADLSGGSLARVNAISAAAEQAAVGSGSNIPAQQMVGNPSYGQWSGSGGNSFWVWYGQYALISRLLGGGRTYYGDWGGRRRYSYYHDVGRRSYSSPRNKVSQSVRERAVKKDFRSQGKRFTSPYARTRAGASGLSRASTAQSKAVFTSPYSKNSSSNKYKSSYQSSARNSSSRTTRGISRGK
ncbi:MAG: hypothetical protein JKY01_03315 [Pseudomonadales bacterium]|nr:hypothetical protein [Pseudomonadales bacterium]